MPVPPHNRTVSMMTSAYIHIRVGEINIASAEHLRRPPLRRPVRAEGQFQRPQIIRPGSIRLAALAQAVGPVLLDRMTLSWTTCQGRLAQGKVRGQGPLEVPAPQPVALVEPQRPDRRRSRASSRGTGRARPGSNSCSRRRRRRRCHARAAWWRCPRRGCAGSRAGPASEARRLAEEEAGEVKQVDAEIGDDEALVGGEIGLLGVDVVAGAEADPAEMLGHRPARRPAAPSRPASAAASESSRGPSRVRPPPRRPAPWPRNLPGVGREGLLHDRRHVRRRGEFDQRPVRAHRRRDVNEVGPLRRNISAASW